MLSKSSKTLTLDLKLLLKADLDITSEREQESLLTQTPRPGNFPRISGTTTPVGSVTNRIIS